MFSVEQSLKRSACFRANVSIVGGVSVSRKSPIESTVNKPTIDVDVPFVNSRLGS